jgi:hypothetical protein
MKIFLAVLAFLVAQILACAIVLVAQPTGGTLRGRVVDSTRKPLVGTTVFLEGTKRGGLSKAPDGVFMVAGIPAGNYTVRIAGLGLTTEQLPIGIVAGETTDVGRIVMGKVEVSNLRVKGICRRSPFNGVQLVRTVEVGSLGWPGVDVSRFDFE